MNRQNILEIRQNGLGFIIEGLIPVLSKSDELYSKEKQIFFKEVIAPQAFKNYLSTFGNNNIKLLIDHNKKNSIARRWTRFEETEKGLEFTAKIYPTPEQKMLLLQNLKGLSFGFIAGINNFVKDATETQTLRILESFLEFSEISIIITKTPAYSKTSVAINATDAEAERQILKNIINKLKIESYKQDLNYIR